MNHTNGSYRSNGTQGAGYPRTGTQFFSNRFLVHIFRAGVATDFGAQAALLLTVVAMTEDKARYRRAVRFWNEQLMVYLGCREDRLIQIRNKLMSAGWLHYAKGGNRTPGTYWVLVPGGDNQIDDAILGANAEGDFNYENPQLNLETIGHVQLRKNAVEPVVDDQPQEVQLRIGGVEPIVESADEPVALLPLPIPPIPEEKRDSTEIGRTPPEKLQEFVSVWNHLPDVPKITQLTDGRKRALRARLRDPAFCDQWRHAMSRIGNSSFCRGKNERGWRADFDWFLKPNTVTKILEGKYDDRTNSNQRRPAGQAGRTPPNVSETGGSVARMFREKYDGDVAGGLATATAD